MKHNKIILFAFMFLVVIGMAQAVRYCYQETANASTVYDGNCSLNYTGAYAWDATAGSPELAFDGDWTTRSVPGAAQTAYHYENDTWPNNINVIQSLSKIQIKYTYQTTNAGDLSCFNGTDWINIGTANGGRGGGGFHTQGGDGSNPAENDTGVQQISLSSTCVYTTNIQFRIKTANLNGHNNAFLYETAMLYRLPSVDSISTQPSNVYMFTSYNITANVTATNTTAINLTLTLPSGTIMNYSMSNVSNVFSMNGLNATTNGTYLINISASNGDSMTSNFTVTDGQVISPNSYSQTVAAGQNFTFSVSINSNTTATLNYNVSCYLPTTNMTCNVVNNITVTPTGTINLTINTSMNISDGQYNGTLNITRNIDGRKFTINLTLGISTAFGKPVILNKVDPAISMLSNEIYTQSFLLMNNGTYNISTCTGTLDSIFTGWSFYTFTNGMNLSVNQTGYFNVTFTNPPMGAFSGNFQISCISTASGLTNSLDTANKPFFTLSSSAPPPVTSTGGGGSTNYPPAKPKCDITVNPKQIDLSSDLNIFEVVIKNSDSSTYNPTFAFTPVSGYPDLSSKLVITNKVLSILQSQSESFGVQYMSDIGAANITSKATLTLSSTNCADIVIPVNINIGKGTGLFSIFNKGYTFAQFIKEPIFAETSSLYTEAPIINIGVVMFIWIIAWYIFLFNNIRESFNQGKIGVVIVWIIFTIVIAAFFTLMTVVVARLFG